MMIAKRIVGETFVIGDYKVLFPDTSFSESGPNNEWFMENDCYRINLDVPYDPVTEELQDVLPYVQNGWAYVSRAVPKTTG
jgi:hypothetical protein